MDADSSYGGSDTAQDSTSGQDNNSSIETTHETTNPHEETAPGAPKTDNHFYHKNEITLPVNYDETDKRPEKSPKLPHYMSTANLNINETLENHSNLEELNKKYNSSSFLNAATPKPTKKIGVDNPAFHQDEEKQNGDLNSSANFTSPTKGVKGDEHMAEAVNLELINLKPSNGKDVTGPYENGINSIPVKKETEVEIGNPYDEYFVPVNEHRKYMRGEKLYITMDKRNKKKRNKCLCWGICLAVVAALVIVGILVATGMIGNNEAQPITEVSARQFSGSTKPIKAAGGLFGTNEIDPPYTPGPSTSTLPTNLVTDTTMIQVPRALEGQLRIENLQFQPELAYTNSTEFREMAAVLEEQIKNNLFTPDVLNYGAANIEVKVLEFMPGSVVVRYRIGWTFKDGLHNTKDPIDPKGVKNTFSTMLFKSSGFMDKYRIDGNSVVAEKVIDMCKIDNNGCEHTCSFNYNKMDFMCECPENMHLGMDMKKCVEHAAHPEPEENKDYEYDDHSNHQHDHNMHEHDHTMHEHDYNMHEHDHSMHHIHEHETVTDEVVTDAIFEDVHTNEHYQHNGHVIPIAEPTTEPNAEPEPTAEPNTEPETEPKSEHETEIISEPEPTAEPKTKPEPTAEPKSEPEPTAEPKSEPESTPEPNSEPEPNPEASLEPETTPEPKSEPEPTPEPNSERESEPEPTAEPKSEETSTEHKSEASLGFVVEPETTAEPEAEPEPTAEPNAESESTPEPSSEAEPTAEPKSEPEPVAISETEESTEAKPEPEPETTAEPKAEPTTTPVPSVENVESKTEHVVEKELISNENFMMGAIATSSESAPTTTPIPEPSTEHMVYDQPPRRSKLNDEEEEVEVATEIQQQSELENDAFKVIPLEHHTTEPAPEPTSEPEPEPTSEPLPEPTGEPEPEPTIQPESEPVSEPEPTSEPEPASEPEPTAQSVSEMIGEVTTMKAEPTSAPEPEPTSAPDSEHTNAPEPEPTSAPEPEPTIVPESETTSAPEPEPTSAPEPEPTSAPIVEPTNAPEPEPTSAPEPEPTSIPIVEPTSAPESEPTNPPESEENKTIVPLVMSSHEASTTPAPKPDPTNAPTILETTVEPKAEPTNKPEVEIVKLIETTNVPEVETTNAPESETTNAPETEPPNTSESQKMPKLLTETTSETTTKRKIETTIAPKIETTVVPQEESKTEMKAEEMTTIMEEAREEATTQAKGIVGHINQLMETTIIPEMTTHQIPVVADEKSESQETEKYNEVLHTTAFETTTRNLKEVNTINAVPIEETTPFQTKTTETHQHLLLTEPTETSNNLDVMSPFLPEIDNDTFVNILHSGGEFHEHAKEEGHEVETTKAPRLDDDQMNTTNPFDMNVVGIMTVTTPKAETTTRTKEVETTLSPDILNNVHSNNFFGDLDRRPIIQEIISTTAKSEESLNDFKEVSSSTEDLIAMETTTYGIKHSEVAKTEMNEVKDSVEENATIHAEVVETVTEIVNVSEKKEEKEHKYEVFEASSDPTTETTLLLKKPTTEINDLQEKLLTEDKDESFLSVIPLPKQPEPVKQDKKRQDDDFNKLDRTELFNDINDEVIDKVKPEENDLRVVESTEPQAVSEETTEEISTEKMSYDKANKKSTLFPDKKDKKNKVKEFEVLKPVTEGFSLSGFSRCATGQFQCINGTSLKDGSYCIPRNDRCDSVDDCSDASDETGCVEEGCPDNFKCTSGQCLKRHLVCDGIFNCNDGSDELECENWSCSFDEFSCGQSQRCIPLSWKCDGRAQCPGAVDEQNCHQQECGNDEFHCIEQDTCIPASWRCDGKSDCGNDEDEKLCECGIDQFKCSMGGGCIQLEQRCDGIEQCADFSDEWNCLRIEDVDTSDNSHHIQILASNKTWHPVCSDSWNSTYSDIVCQNLGFTGASNTEYIPAEDSEKYFKLKSTPQFGATIIAQLEATTEKCENVVSITCQEFTCGSHSTLDAQSARIIGGNNAASSQWPSVALLYNKKYNVKCTASLIASKWVIASHSCMANIKPHSNDMNNPKDWTLYAGGTKFFNNADNSTTQIRMIKEIIPHPQAKYAQFEFVNDAVLVELTTPLTTGRNVSAICLPNNEIEDRQLCVTAGWGVNKPGEPNVQQYLNYLPVPTIEMSECNSTKHYNGHLTKDKICAGYTDSDKTPCYNDEGAPLMCFSESANAWELQGILSHHGNCGRSHHPSIYTSLNVEIRRWIANTIGSEVFRRSA